MCLQTSVWKWHLRKFILCLRLWIYFLIGKKFGFEIFTSYSMCMKVPFSVNLSSFKQYIQNLGPYQWKNDHIWKDFCSFLLILWNSSILKIIFKKNNLLDNLIGFRSIYTFRVRVLTFLTIFFSTEPMHLKFYTQFTILQKSWLLKMDKKYWVHYGKFIPLTLNWHLCEMLMCFNFFFLIKKKNSLLPSASTSNTSNNFFICYLST